MLSPDPKWLLPKLAIKHRRFKMQSYEQIHNRSNHFTFTLTVIISSECKNKNFQSTDKISINAYFL